MRDKGYNYRQSAMEAIAEALKLPALPLISLQ